MKIALVAPFDESVPPQKYGGTELVVQILADELCAMGHSVTLFASGDSKTTAHLVPGLPKSIRTLPEARDEIIREGLEYMGIAKTIEALQKGRFDIVHNHLGWQLLLFNRLIAQPILTTIHRGLIFGYERYMYGYYKQLPYISISNSQRRPCPEFNFLATVYHGIQVDKFEFGLVPDDYLMFLGRIAPEKGPLQAIKIAKAAKKPLIIAAKIDPVNEEYYNRRIKPLIDGRQIQFVGEVNHPQKVKLLKKALALVSPIQWEEPFGLVNAEALACGTPVIGSPRGSLPEIIQEGKTGFLCRSVAEAAKRVADVCKINRAYCRQYAEQHFCARRMASQYVEAYTRVIKSQGATV